MILLELIIISLINIPYLDDFCNYIIYRKDNFLNTILERYTNKEGRFFSIPFIVQIALFKYLPIFRYSIITLIWFLIFFIAINITVKIFEQKNTFFKTIIYTAIFLLAIYPIAGEVVFWETGGAYSLAFLCFIQFIYFINRYGVFSPFTVFSYIATISIGPNFSIPLVILITFELMFFRKESKFLLISYFLIYLLLTFIGVFILLNSRGSELRMDSVSNYFIWNIRYISEVYFNLLFKFIISIWYIIILVLAFFINDLRKRIQSRETFLSLIYNYRYLISSLFIPLVFIKQPGLCSIRTAFPFYILILLQTLNVLKKSNFYFSHVIKSVVLTCLTVFYGYVIVLRIEFRNEYIVASENTLNGEDNEIIVFYINEHNNVPFRNKTVVNNELKWFKPCINEFYLRRKSNGIVR